MVLQGGVSNERLVLYAPPDKTVSVLMNETGCVTCLDFSTDGRLLVSGACHAHSYHVQKATCLTVKLR